MDLIRDLGDISCHLGIANIHRAIAEGVGRRLAGPSL